MWAAGQAKSPGVVSRAWISFEGDGDDARLGRRHGLQQILELLQSADFPNQPQEFVQAIKTADDLDRLGYCSNLLEGNRVGLLLRRCHDGSGGHHLFSVELVVALGAGFRSWYP